eukprot:TRINITY_DN4682_c0_g1_i1.p1 TRINITY_DN4682_c0_g1~~TRINITY_DN4682_c0_g1_i1.p1  ORF type:complete len:359 (-),score=92.29 TRINITY_DN4682_c0_g1_i1:340-1416(-)
MSEQRSDEDAAVVSSAASPTERDDAPLIEMATLQEEGERTQAEEEQPRMVTLSQLVEEQQREKRENQRREGRGGNEDEEAEDDEPEAITLSDYASVVVTILKPVSITMALVIAAVRILNMSEQGTSVPITFVYAESANDSNTVKFLGAIINAFVFLVMIVVMTFVLVLLYKYRCIKIIVGWLFVSTGLLLGLFGGYLFLLLLVQLSIPLDAISFCFILWNFSVTGILAIFWHVPLLLNQIYLVTISFIMATVLTQMPEWTTWAILVVVAIYDLFAVLCPKGPLNILVKMAQQRKEPLPALIYSGGYHSPCTHGAHFWFVRVAHCPALLSIRFYGNGQRRGCRCTTGPRGSRRYGRDAE